MSIPAIFYTLGKRVNSTLQPSGSGTNFDIVLKTPTSMLNPTIQLQTTNPTTYNYCYIAYFGRYYFVGDWTCVHSNLWEVSLKSDPMASFKSTILGGTHYVLRSASQYDGDIVDNLYPTKGNVDIILGDTIASPFSNLTIGGTSRIVGILNSSTSNKFGAVQYFIMSESELGTLMKYIYGENVSSTNIWADIESVVINREQTWAQVWGERIGEAVIQSMDNPGQFITESFMLPYTPPNVGVSSSMKFGFWTLPSAISGTIITSTSSQFPITSGDLDLPDHPQHNDRGPYTRLSPYMEYWLYLGPFGTYHLDPTLVYNDRTVHFNIFGDLMGNISCKLYVDSQLIDVLHANVKCNFPVAQVSMDVSRAAQAGLNIAGSAVRVASGDTVGGIVSGSSGIISATDALIPKMNAQGSQGTFVNVFDDFYSVAAAHWIVDEMNTERGRPLCQSVVLSSLTGYCLCSDAEVSISGTAEEAQEINNYLNTGFFIE